MAPHYNKCRGVQSESTFREQKGGHLAVLSPNRRSITLGEGCEGWRRPTHIRKCRNSRPRVPPVANDLRPLRGRHPTATLTGEGHAKVREVPSGPAEWRRRQPGPRRKNGHLIFPDDLGQSVSLDARFGDQIASPLMGRVKSRTGGVRRKSLRRAGSRERKRRIDPFESRTKQHFIDANRAHSPE